jgi:hypothetical protein
MFYKFVCKSYKKRPEAFSSRLEGRSTTSFCAGRADLERVTYVLQFHICSIY